MTMDWLWIFKDFLANFVDPDKLSLFVAGHEHTIYLVLFAIVFCETGLVVTPILPGDSMLFTAGAVVGIGSLNPLWLFIVLSVAAILGDTVNYWIGALIGPRAFSGNIRFLKKKHLDRTHAFYEKYGGKTIILARFVPIVRTFAPFVAGVGIMNYTKFIVYNVVGGVAWVALCVGSGYVFGNNDFVKEHFSLIILAIVLISVMPMVVEYLRFGGNPLNELSRHADVEHVQTADVRRGLGRGETGLGGDERAGLGGANRVPGGPAGVAVQPAGQIDRQLRHGGRVELVDDGIQRRAGFAPGAGAQQAVDDPRGALQQFRQPRRIVRRCRKLRSARRSLRGCGSWPRRRRSVPSGSAQSSTRTGWPRRSRCRATTKPSPALFPLPQQMTTGPGDAQPAEHVGHAPPGVLHQHQPAEAELLDGQLIDQPRLLAGEGWELHD